jgi:hypothetical protein
MALRRCLQNRADPNEINRLWDRRIICSSRCEVAVTHQCDSIPHVGNKPASQAVKRRGNEQAANRGGNKRVFFALCRKTDIVLNNMISEPASHPGLASALLEGHVFRVPMEERWGLGCRWGSTTLFCAQLRTTKGHTDHAPHPCSHSHLGV